MAISTLFREPTMYGTQLMNNSLTSIPGFDSSLSTCLMACLLNPPRAMANGAHRQGCAGHHAQRRVRQGVDPFCMQIIAKQAVEEFLGISKLCRSLANLQPCFLRRRQLGSM